MQKNWHAKEPRKSGALSFRFILLGLFLPILLGLQLIEVQGSDDIRMLAQRGIERLSQRPNEIPKCR